MTKIDIFSGFLGAGKTTLIKKLIKEGYKNEKLVLIENEFGEIGIDGGFLKEAGIQINEMNSGCICCSLVGDFRKALTKVLEQYNPDRIIIEPSGVGKLSGCGAGHEYLAVAPSGDIYPCHQFVGNEDYKMGNVYDGTLNEDIRSEFERSNVYTKEKCKDCFAKFYCSGGCSANAYNFNGDINKPYELGCEFQKKRLECAIAIEAHKKLG